jgi:nitrous oxidase accessory protein
MTRIAVTVMAVAAWAWSQAAAPSAAAAATLHAAAGDGYLQQVISTAAPGDVITVGAGLHRGPIVVDRPLVLDGEDGAVVDGGGAGNVITISAPDVVVRGLTVRDSGARLDTQDSGIFVDKAGDRALIEDNVLEHNLIGIYFWGPDDAVARNNRITGRSDLRMNERGNGIQLWNTPGSVVEGNDVRFGRDGIFVTTSKRNIFRGNRFRDLRFAIHYMYTNDSRITDNDSAGNHVGYALMYSHRLTVSGNRSVGDRDHGFLLNYGNNSVLEDNVVRDGGNKCVFIYNSNKNAFRGNRFEGCRIGIHFTAGSERNTITGNAFVDNRTQVKYVGTRHLDWSRDGRGNYWSDNPAFDMNGDGLADRPYRPNDIVDQIVWTHPTAKLLLNSPAVQAVRWAQAAFPGLHPGGVVDSAPLMVPPTVRGDGS